MRAIEIFEGSVVDFAAARAKRAEDREKTLRAWVIAVPKRRHRQYAGEMEFAVMQAPSYAEALVQCGDGSNCPRWSDRASAQNHADRWNRDQAAIVAKKYPTK